MTEAEELLDRVLYLLDNDIRVAPATILHEDISNYMKREVEDIPH